MIQGCLPDVNSCSYTGFMALVVKFDVREGWTN